MNYLVRSRIFPLAVAFLGFGIYGLVTNQLPSILVALGTGMFCGVVVEKLFDRRNKR